MGVIYKIECKPLHRVYIGKSTSFDSRRKAHRNNLNNNRHSNHRLQEDFNKYGWKDIDINIVEEVENNRLDEREDYWINFYGGVDSPNVYNRQTNKDGFSEKFKNMQRSFKFEWDK